MPVIPAPGPAETASDDPGALLQAAEGRRGTLPWLFSPDAFDWQWRSWRQGRDQVARAVAELRRFGVAEEVEAPARLSPDAVVAAWAGLLCGLRVRPVSGRQAAADAAAGEGSLRWRFDRREAAAGPLLPPVRSRLEPWAPEPLPGRRDAEPAGPLVHRSADASEVEEPWAHLLRRADELLATLGWEAAAEPPLLLVCGRLDGLGEQVALVAAVRSGAAVALEPEVGALAGSVARLRPEVVVAPPEVLRGLPAAFASRWARRWSRLRAVVVPRGYEMPAEVEGLADLPLVVGPWTVTDVGGRPDPDGP